MSPAEYDRAVADIADRIFMSGILDDIADDAANNRLHRRDAMADAVAIAELALREPE